MGERKVTDRQVEIILSEQLESNILSDKELEIANEILEALSECLIIRADKILKFCQKALLYKEY